MRKLLFKILDDIHPSIASKAYDILMLAAIILSIVPLMFRYDCSLFTGLEIFGCSVFIFDYLAKWITADMRSGAKGVKVFLRYPFTAWAIFDLFTILPSLNLVNRGLVTLRMARMAKILRILRVYEGSSNIRVIMDVLRSEAAILTNVLGLCVVYIFVSALIMFNYEDNLENFFEALYWATTALTTVGYGDVCPQSDAGKLISMISSLVGIAIIALPSGIITARYLEELTKYKNR